MSGWVKLYRSTLDSAIDNCPKDTQLLWYKLLQRVNYKPRKGYFNGDSIWVRPGQFTTSYKDLSALIDCSESSVREHIKRLIDLDMIIFDTSSTGSLLTINNWFKFQSKYETFDEIKRCNTNKKQSDEEQTGQQHKQRDGERVGNKEEKEEGEVCQEEKSNDGVSPEAEKIFDYWQRLDGTTTHETNIYQHKKSIDRRLNDFSPKQLCEAIKRLNGLYTGKYDTWLTTKWSCRDFMKTKSGEHIEKMLKSFEHFLNDSANSNNTAKKQFEEEAV